MMVAGFVMVGQVGEASTLEQSARRHPERVDTHAWHHGHAWSPHELSPQASLRPKIMSGMLFMVVLKLPRFGLDPGAVEKFLHTR